MWFERASAFEAPAIAADMRTTCVATMLEGGHAPNALPQLAKANVNCRIFPGHPVADVQAALQNLSGAGVTVGRTENRAHGRDERVQVKSFYDGVEYLYRLVKVLAGGR